MDPKDLADIFLEDFKINLSATQPPPLRETVRYNHGKIEYYCPKCGFKLDNPSLYVIKNYFCYRCRSPIITGIWPTPEYSEKNPETYWGHETALHPAIQNILKYHGIELSFGYTNEAGFSYWRQMCPHCKAAQGDYHIRNHFSQIKSNAKLYEINPCDALYCRHCLNTFIKQDFQSPIDKCFECNGPVSVPEKNYCLNRQNIFKGNIYCRACQKIITGKK